jgi:hypothetical protein
MSAVHIDLVFGEHSRKQEDGVSEEALKENALLVDKEVPADEPLKDDEPDELQCASEHLEEEK